MATFASVVEDDPNTTYLLPFGNAYYHVPTENVMVKSIRTNSRTCAEIDAVVRSRAPEAWKRCLTFGRIMRIRGVEGNELYTTFAPTDGTYEEQRVLRLVPWRIAHACFPEVKEWAMCNQSNRERAFAELMAIYDWRKEVDLPDALRIDPRRNNWPQVTLEHPVVVRAPAPPPPPPPSDPMEDFALADPMEDWDAHLETEAADRRVPAPPVRRHNASPSVPADVDAMAYQAFNEDLVLQRQVHEELSAMRARARARAFPPPPARPSAPMAEDLRVLSDFLFECKDLVPEGAYLEASDALQRVWENAI